MTSAHHARFCFCVRAAPAVGASAFVGSSSGASERSDECSRRFAIQAAAALRDARRAPRSSEPLNPGWPRPSVVSGNKRGNRCTVRCVQRVEGDGRETLYSAVRTLRQGVNKVEGLVLLMRGGSSSLPGGIEEAPLFARSGFEFDDLPAPHSRVADERCRVGRPRHDRLPVLRAAASSPFSSWRRRCARVSEGCPCRTRAGDCFRGNHPA